MNSTHRLLNRAVVLVAGLLLLGAGTAAVLLGTVPAFRDAWRIAASDALAWLGDRLGDTPLPGTPHSWLLLAGVVLAAVLVFLAVLLVVAQGRGRTATLVARSDEGVAIDTAVAERAITEALARRSGILSAKVAAYSVRGTTVLKVSVAVRRGISPRETLAAVEDVVRAWDRALGRELPVLVDIGSNLRTRFGRPSRVA